MDKQKLVLPVSILSGCLILGAFYYASEVNKQKSTERQQQVELQIKKEIELSKIESDRKSVEMKKQADIEAIKTESFLTMEQLKNDELNKLKLKFRDECYGEIKQINENNNKYEENLMKQCQTLDCANNVEKMYKDLRDKNALYTIDKCVNIKMTNYNKIK